MRRRDYPMRNLRWVILAIGVALGTVLISRGQDLIGGLVLGSALLRAVFILSVVHGRGGSQPGAPPEVRGVLRRLARAEFEVAARAIGSDPARLRSEFDHGRSIAELASDAGVAVGTVVDAVIRDASVRLDRAVAEGTLSSASADLAKARLPIWAPRLLAAHKGELRGPRRAVV